MAFSSIIFCILKYSCSIIIYIYRSTYSVSHSISLHQWCNFLWSQQRFMGEVVSWKLPYWAILVWTVIAKHYIILRPLPATDALVWTQNHSQDLFNSTTGSHCLQNSVFLFFWSVCLLRNMLFGHLTIIVWHFICLSIKYWFELLHLFDYILWSGDSYKSILV